MSLIDKAIRYFLGQEGQRSSIFLGADNSIINRPSPFISADNKQQYIDDFTKVKYAYAVVHWLAKKCAKVPFVLYRKTPNGKEQVDVSRLLEILEKPNSYQTRFRFLYQFYGFLFTTGAGYIYAPKATTGRFSEMHVIPSDFVQPVYEKAFAGPTRFIISDSGISVPAEDMIYCYFDDLHYEQVGVGQDGLSPFKSLKTIIQKTSDIDLADLSSIQNGGVMGIMSIQRNAEEGLTSEQAGQVEQKVKQKAYGPDNKGKFFVTSGDVKWIPIGLSSIDLNLYESNKQVLKDICIVLNVPYTIFDSDATNKTAGAGQKEARAQAYTDVILPAVELLIDTLNGGSVKAFGENLVLDYSTNEIEELQRDQKTLAETLALQHWKTLADKQRESGMDVDPEMEGVYLFPNNLVKADDVLSDFQLDLNAGDK
jgi:HK97 family phage portal protein